MDVVGEKKLHTIQLFVLTPVYLNLPEWPHTRCEACRGRKITYLNPPNLVVFNFKQTVDVEHISSVIECRTRNRESQGSNPPFATI